MAISIPGLISIIVFYLLILAIGIWAGRKSKSTEKNANTEEVMLAGRNIGVIVGVFTMTATWVGGGFINGTAEVVFNPGYGLVWCQAPVGYALSLLLGGLIFARKMREQRYVTMLDPLQQKLGHVMGGMLFFPALLGEIFWSAAILSALGASLTVILEIDHITAIIVSACVAVLYTLFGGLYSVAYTDVVQLVCILIGLCTAIPFAVTHSSVTNIADTAPQWLGTFDVNYTGMWIDSALLLIFGGIPWQAYFQRVLSSRSPSRAQALSFVAAVGCILLAIPPVIIGAIGASTDWNQTSYNGTIPIPPDDYKLILPLVLQYLCPIPVAFIGLGAVSAAVMSSADSSILSVSSMFARNIYKQIFRRRASEREVVWVMRLSIFVAGGLAATMGITINTIYGLWYLCSDLVYVILFPQLLCTIYYKYSNTYGSVAAFILGLLFRLAGGEPLIFLPPFLKYPFYSESTSEQLFPFKTLSMIISLITLLLISGIFHLMFIVKGVNPKFDIFGIVKRHEKITRPVVDDTGDTQQEGGKDNMAYSSSATETIKLKSIKPIAM